MLTNQKTEGLRLLSDNNRSLHRTLVLSSLLLTIVLSGTYLFNPKAIEIINLRVTDIIIASAKAPEPTLDVVTVAIDEATIYQTSSYLFSPLLPTVSVTLGCCLFLTLKFHYFQQQARAETGNTLLLLKSSETNLQSTLNTIPDIVFRLDPRR